MMHVKTKVQICFQVTAKLISGFVTHVCFHYTNKTIPLFSKSKSLTIFCSCTAQFYVGPVWKTHCWFSHNAALIYSFFFFFFFLFQFYIPFKIISAHMRRANQ